ncbi:MAG: putative zinc-binding dehydrogenase [Ilumatobacteraceae bacterium]|nr:putative zinc-binding dehydrogenase [Ilumatobacteraceae bacterium]
MHAAVVTSFDRPPTYTPYADPSPSNEDEIVVDVIASGLHPRVRSQADGSHYTSTDELPLVPGIDGVGRSADGELRYFVLPDTTLGAMAERTVIDRRRSIVLPADTDPIRLAAAMNPAMSSWVALRRRIDFAPGSSVLVLGATGSAGQMAVQIARHLGAARVVGAGRDTGRLASLVALGADDVVSLDGDPATVAATMGQAGADVDVVIDYVWGRPTVEAMHSIVTARRDPSQPLTWIQIGSVAGPDADIPSAALRACRLQLVGSGQGSVSTRDILAELPALAAYIATAPLRVNALAVPLTDIEAAWTRPSVGDERLVITP